MKISKLKFLIWQRKFQIGAVQREINRLIEREDVDFIKVRELVNKQLTFRSQMRTYIEDLQIIGQNEESKSI